MEDLVDDPIKWLQDLSKNRIIIPERTFLFVINPSDSVARIQNRDNLIPFEKVDFLEKVHKNYLNICRGKRFFKLEIKFTIIILLKI